MSANWYCNIHGTSQLLSCEKCEIEENDMAHEGCREKLTSLRKEVERYREALESCGKLDRSKEYEYGEVDRQGNKPGPGQRWKTPKEIAKEALSGREGRG